MASAIRSEASTPSASTWIWRAEYNLYYNPGLNAWAQYCAETGAYRYLPSTDQTTTAAAAASGGDKEEGELSDDELPVAAEQYNDPRQFAFPAADDELAAPATRPATTFRQEFLRLVCLRSACLPEEQKLATLSSYQPDGYSIGRDRQIGSEEGRIRLREMEVSKTHAIIFYEPPEAAPSRPAAEEDDGGWGSAYLDRDASDPLPAAPTKPKPKPKEKPRGSWAIVDLGSTHGTFIKAHGASDAGKSKGERLSAAKVASLPRTLAHGDVVKIGSSRFEVHLHPSLPCDACSLSSASALISTSIHPSAARDGSLSPSAKAPPALHDPFAGLSSKERIQRLRQDMLKSKSQAAAPAPRRPLKRPLEAEGGPAQDEDDAPQQPAYVDRAAARRAVHPSYSHATAVAVAVARATASSPAPRALAATPAQGASTPLPATNVGHSLLLKHGWTPGQALGSGSTDGPGRVKPVEVTRSAGEGRRGLGMKSVATGPALGGGGDGDGEEKADWRDEGRAKRWAMLN